MHKMEKILQKLGLVNLLSRFLEERVDENVVLASTDSELSRLGVATIGDRVRLRELCKEVGEVNTPASTSREVHGLFHD